MAALVASNVTKTKASAVYDGSSFPISSELQYENEKHNIDLGLNQLNLADNFKSTSDLIEVFDFIKNYTPETIEIETILRPFLLDYIPAVGDVDPFLKVSMPDQEQVSYKLCIFLN